MVMCSIGPLAILLMASTLSAGNPVTTTARSTTYFGETIKQLTNQLMEINATSSDVITLDTRTPPRVKQQVKTKNRTVENLENSHAGVAIPLDTDDITLEETTKKLNFYKIERPTTNSGLSTWILLSGQTTSTTKPPKKAIVKPNEDKNITLVVDQNKIIKPIFKKRVTTTRKPPVTTASTTTTLSTTVASSKTTTTTTKLNTKLNKVNSAVNNVTTTTTVTPISNTTKKKQSTTTIKPTAATNSTTALTPSTSNLAPEAKDGDTDLSNAADKKNKSTTAKRKKNKKRRRPATDKVDSNSTKIEKHKNKDKPLGTQLYNYLSREVMPTVGVGLVGLMVTAGLASYFLYPFSPVRRSYEVDRRDKEGSYYYNDEFSGGIAEEEAIGKVIAGMPAKSLFENHFKPQTNKNVPSSIPNRQVNHRMSQEPSLQYNQASYDYHYNKGTIESSHDTNDDRYVVANVQTVQTDEVTPAAVPEHGPRSLKLRKRRQTEPEKGALDNEIKKEETSEPVNSFLLDMVKSLIQLKYRLFSDSDITPDIEYYDNLVAEKFGKTATKTRET